MPVGALAPTIVAFKPETGQPVALPDSTYVLAPGDTVFAIAIPESLRRLERAAVPLEPSLVQRGRESDPEPNPAPGEGPDIAEPNSPGTTEEDVSATDDAGRDEGTSTAEDTAAAGGADDTPTAGDADSRGVSGRADASSFEQLKEEFESGEANWTDTGESSPGETGADEEDGDGLDRTEETGSEEFAAEAEELDGLFGESGDDPGVGLPESTDDDGFVEEDSTPAGSDDRPVGGDGFDLADGEAPDFDDVEDDLAALGVDESGEGLDLDDDSAFDEVPDNEATDRDDGDGDEEDSEDDDRESADGDGDEDENGDEGEDADTESDDEGNDTDGSEDSADEDSGDDSGGGKSFQQLKEEFESGDADWEDDVSDSPGGDMRLDE